MKKFHPIKGNLEVPALYDRWLLAAVLGLLVIGLLMVASSSIVIATRQYHTPFHFLFRQLAYVSLGIIFAIIAMQFKIENWQRLGMPLLLLSVVLLIAVFIPGIGRAVNGSSRWINLGPIGIQVSEVTKFFMIVYMAGYIVRHHLEIQTKVSGFVKPMVLLTIIAALLLKEPDFGAATVIMLTALAMLYLGGVRFWQFLILLALVVAGLAILAISSPYRMARRQRHHGH